jgi:uncharacterized protein
MTTFSLRRLRLRSGEELREEEELALAPFELGGQRYLPVPDRVPAALEITRASSGTVFVLRFHARVHGPCQRCLADAVVDREIGGREYQASDPGAGEELRSPYVRDEQLDLSGWARDLLALALPDQILCREDCAGLCAVCGRDLNADPHEHADERADPRWAALEGLREQL